MAIYGSFNTGNTKLCLAGISQALSLGEEVTRFENVRRSDVIRDLFFACPVTQLFREPSRRSQHLR